MNAKITSARVAEQNLITLAKLVHSMKEKRKPRNVDSVNAILEEIRLITVPREHAKMKQENAVIVF